jgi:hypothetical protein
MTSADRLLLVADLGIDELELEALTGVPKLDASGRLGVAADKPEVPTKLAPEITRSSSSKKVAFLGGVRSSGLLDWTDHTPFGSIVTCSTEPEVSSRMSLTYLGGGKYWIYGEARTERLTRQLLAAHTEPGYCRLDRPIGGLAPAVANRRLRRSIECGCT